MSVRNSDQRREKAVSEHVIWVRSYGERLPNGQWQAFCVTFNLAVQADSMREAQVKLQGMVDDYLKDAVAEKDPVQAKYLLSRRASPYFWAKYWLIWLKLRLSNFVKRPEPYISTYTFAAHTC